MSPLPLIPPSDGYNHLTLPDGSSDVKFKWAPTISQEVELKTTLHRMDGRTWPLAYFAEYADYHWTVEFTIDKTVDGDQWANFFTLFTARTPLVWTDVFGNQFNCVVTVDPSTRDMLIGGIPDSVSGRPQGGRFQKIRFRVDRIE